MSVGFILGRSGTGKSRFCIDSIREELQKDSDTPLILLVPEQGTYQAERAILDSQQIRGYSRLNVLSFDRLQFLLLSRSTAREVFSQLARRMLVYRILRENVSSLQMFGESSRHIGLSSRIAEVISELHRYGKTVEQLDELVEKLKGKEGEYAGRAAMKFSDIRFIFERYTEAVKGKFLDPDVQLSMGLSQVSSADFVKNGKLWVDGFSSFTGVELKMLAELIKHTSESHIALCMDYNQTDLRKPGADQLSIFYPVQKTYTELLEMVKQIEVKIEPPVLLDKTLRFTGNKPLGELESNFLRDSGREREAGDTIDIVRTEDPRSEVRYTARKIREFVREQNARYRNIAVIASDLSGYEHYIRAIFGDYEIPYFIDTRQPLSMHPGVGAINSALRAVSEGYEPSNIFAYLKSGLVMFEPEQIDLLENYCLCFGVTAASWKNRKEWRFDNKTEPEFDEDKVNRIKQRVLEPLYILDARLKPGQGEKISVEDFVRAVYGFIEDAGLKERLSEWIRAAHKSGEIEQSETHRQFYSKLVDLLDEMTEVFAGTSLPADEWCEILQSGFEQIKLGFVPAAIDEVLVGSVERSRHPDLEAVFVLGATQRDFPVPVSSEGLIEDEERELAEQEGFGLGQSVTENLICRQYLSYIAFTRASEYLCVCYPATDKEGKPQLRSRYVDALEAMFSDLTEQEWVSDKITPENSESEFELRELLCSRLGDDSNRRDNTEKHRYILDKMQADDDFKETADTVNKVLEYENKAALSRQITERMFPAELNSSSTRLGCYAQCPFRYFARYVLALEKRKEFTLEPLDVGAFYHKVLDSLFRRLKSESGSFSSLPEDELVKVLEEQVEKVMADDNFISQFKNRKDHNVYVITSAVRELEECTKDIRKLELAGDFEAELSEVEFGYGQDILGGLRFELSGGRKMNLSGKIDRIDICQAAGREAVIIFDYKTRNAGVDYYRVYNGLDLQLPLYMLAVRKFGKLPDIAGGFLIPVESSAETCDFNDLKKEEKFGRKARGFFNGEWALNLDKVSTRESEYYSFYLKDGEPYGHYKTRDALKPDDFERLLQFTGDKVISIAEKILGGDISVAPYKLNDNTNACKWCPYRPVCRYDWQINEPNYVERVGKKEFLERLKE